MTIQITDIELKELIKNAAEQAAKQAAEQAVNAYIAQTTTSSEEKQPTEVKNVSQEAREAIIEEFNLAGTNHKFEKNIHWEIGNGWEN